MGQVTRGTKRGKDQVQLSDSLLSSATCVCVCVMQEGACASGEDTKLLTMAGLFDIWYSEEEPLYTYTVITVDATDSFSKIHHRLPVGELL